MPHDRSDRQRDTRGGDQDSIGGIRGTRISGKVHGIIQLDDAICDGPRGIDVVDESTGNVAEISGERARIGVDASRNIPKNTNTVIVDLD